MCGKGFTSPLGVEVEPVLIFHGFAHLFSWSASGQLWAFPPASSAGTLPLLTLFYPYPQRPRPAYSQYLGFIVTFLLHASFSAPHCGLLRTVFQHN